MVVGLMLSATLSYACTNLTIKGSYGFLLTGTKSNTSAAIVGQITADGSGHLTGSETVSANGVISSNVALTGKYSISAACTGTAQITASGFSAANYKITIVSTGKQIEMVDTDSGTTESGYALARGTSTCTPAALKATFGSQGGGFNSSLVPYAVAGQTKLDGLGHISGSQTESSGGVIFSGLVTGTYTVNPDCTGSATTSFHGLSAHTNFVIVNGDNSILAIETDAGFIVTTAIAKQ
jgi:hypothetical protein